MTNKKLLLILNIEFIHIDLGIIQIEGYVLDKDLKKNGDIQVIARDNNGREYIAKWSKKEKSKEYYNLYTKDKTFFILHIILNDDINSFTIYTKNYEIENIADLEFKKYIKFDKTLKYSYYVQNNYCISYCYGKFMLYKDKRIIRFKLEFKVLLQLMKKQEFKGVIFRIITFILKQIKKREIWVFIDRLDKADDNAEALFKYSMLQKDNIKKYFFVNKNTSDFIRLRNLYKNIIPYGTYKQKLIMLLSNKVISSHIDVPMRYPFDGAGYFLRSLTDFKFVFLQHGIIKDNLSNWLNRYNKDIGLFITSTEDEYNSILTEDYGYTPSIVKLTGLPRYDNLEEKSKNEIIIMPTWRNSLVNIMKDNGEREYSNKFKDTQYYNQYNNMINDERLINAAKKKGIRILFMPHPNMQCQIEDFDKNGFVEFVEYSKSYNELICECKLLITDYSSVAFDFAYIGKPIVYHQFDYNEVFSNKQKLHIYKKGYFNYETMGFGPVSYNYEDTIKYILQYIENDFVVEDIYINRRKCFFKFRDKKNSERVYNEIRGMK